MVGVWESVGVVISSVFAKGLGLKLAIAVVSWFCCCWGFIIVFIGGIICSLSWRYWFFSWALYGVFFIGVGVSGGVALGGGGMMGCGGVGNVFSGGGAIGVGVGIGGCVGGRVVASIRYSAWLFKGESGGKGELGIFLASDSAIFWVFVGVDSCGGIFVVESSFIVGIDVLIAVFSSGFVNRSFLPILAI